MHDSLSTKVKFLLASLLEDQQNEN